MSAHNTRKRVAQSLPSHTSSLPPSLFPHLAKSSSPSFRRPASSFTSPVILTISKSHQLPHFVIQHPPSPSSPPFSQIINSPIPSPSILPPLPPASLQIINSPITSSSILPFPPPHHPPPSTSRQIITPARIPSLHPPSYSSHAIHPPPLALHSTHGSDSSIPAPPYVWSSSLYPPDLCCHAIPPGTERIACRRERSRVSCQGVSWMC